MVENYRQGSASGISITFLLVWMVGDITNLAGAVWAGLVPTVIALAVYFCFADAVLLSQCFYYNTINARREREASVTSSQTEDGAPTANEQAPLLGDRRRSSEQQQHQQEIGLPGSRRRSSAASRRSTRNSGGRRDSLAKILEEDQSSGRAWLRNALSVIVIIVAGAAGWAIAWKSGVWRPTPIEDPNNDDSVMPLGAEVLGYASAVCYLGARIPQIIKNYREKSCDGLSLLFFLLSVMGNLTYGAGILLHSVEKQYFLKNLPWLIGSLGTIAEDAFIFFQFSRYGEKQSAIED